MSKVDAQLGATVQEYLKSKGVETPMSETVESKMTYDLKMRALEQSFSDVLSVLGLDLSDDSLRDTPRRMAKMYLQELFTGLDYSTFPKATTVDNKMVYDEMVTVKDIAVMSTCEHHLVTIDGQARVAYIPKNKVLGLSKINRIVEFFSRRPQIQERLTAQIYHALSSILETENVAVQINAVHYCVKSRGVGDTNSSTTTTKLGGLFTRPSVRAEFLA